MTGPKQLLVVDAVEDFLVALSAVKPSPHTLAAYRRDLVGVAGRVAAAQGVELGQLPLTALDKASLRRAFAAWAGDHAKASTIRAWSAWNAFFRHLVTDDVVEGNPMDGVGKPRRAQAPVIIRGPDVTARLLEAAATVDSRARLREALRRRDVFVPGSRRWADPRRQLLSGAEWEAARDGVCRSVAAHPILASSSRRWPTRSTPPTGGPRRACPTTLR